MSQTNSHVRDVGQVTIVGTGLLGGSIGLGLRATGYGGRIVGVGRRDQTVRRAEALGCIDEGTTDLGKALCCESGLLVVLATPLAAYEKVLGELANSVEDDDKMVVTDVGSTKQHVCATAKRLLPENASFVGSHPMAGGEQHGPDQAVADLFQGKPCVIADEPDTCPAAMALTESLWLTLGMRPVRMTALEHDHQTAIISHLPHAVAAMLVQLGCRSDAMGVASTGFRDTTRIASGDPDLWLDIFSTNRSELLKAIDTFGIDLSRLRQLIEDNDRPALLDMLGLSKARRDLWLDTFEGENTTKGK